MWSHSSAPGSKPCGDRAKRLLPFASAAPPPPKRLRLRQEQAAPVLVILKADLITLRQRPEVLP